MSGPAEPSQPSLEALLLDVGHTLLLPAVPVEQTYAEIAEAFGVERSPARIRAAFAEAFQRPVPGGGESLRYVGDGRPFWRRVVAHATGSKDPELFEALYGHYADASAWRLSPRALPALQRLRHNGVRVSLVSNWDTRLRPMLQALQLTDHVDAVVISCEVGFEKPNPRIFLAACEALGVAPERSLMVGDDPRADAAGARLAGCRAWTWGRDVADFDELARRLSGTPAQKVPRTPTSGTSGGPTT